MTTLRLAHRGDWRAAPENSLAAMRAALEIPGCDGLELDVRASLDGVPVILHDPSLARVQGIARPVAAVSERALRDLGVPTLAEVLEAAGSEPFLDVEFKTSPIPAAIEILAAARGSDLERAVVSSFRTADLAWLRQERPRWPRWLNTHLLGPDTVARAVYLGCMAISADWRAIDAAGVARARAAGLGVAAWTVRHRSTYRRLERLGVVAICAEAAALDG